MFSRRVVAASPRRHGRLRTAFFKSASRIRANLRFLRASGTSNQAGASAERIWCQFSRYENVALTRGLRNLAERNRVLAALDANAWRRQDAALYLGINRKILWGKMCTYQIVH
ncbi:hypothetical protein FAZ95_12675 [Trinickia violacea]|uniref:DNA binding HTH domain-containing protein n=1 Tax=Trinickia violacea TaxID=2571746 RepID=A0A4P8IPQ0_9BURK|nr:hypothetical protein FAZ95_12675 [Trinickia violacea]